MLKAALFSDGTKEYRIPEEPECGDKVTIRFRTGAGDVDHVYAVVRDAVSREEGRRLELKKKESIGRFDFYETEILVGETPSRRSGDRRHGCAFRDHSGIPCTGMGEGCPDVPDLRGPV